MMRTTRTVEFNYTGITAGITYQPVVTASEIPWDEALYINNFWSRAHGVAVTIAPATSLLEVGLSPDPAKDPGFTRSSFYYPNFTGFVIGVADPIFRNPTRWEEPDLFTYIRYIGPAMPTVRWHVELVFTVSLLPKPITEPLTTLARSPLVVWPPVGNVQIGGL